MLRSQKVQLEMSKNRQALNTLLKKDDLEEKELAEVTRLTETLDKQETEYRAFLEAEDQVKPAASEKPPSDRSPEEKEVRTLVNKVEVRHYLSAAMRDRDISGPAKELNQAIGVNDAGAELPLFMLDPDPEKRADAVSSFQADTAELKEVAYLSRVFAVSLTAHLGIPMHSVGAGEAFATVMTTGASADIVDVSSAVDADAATFSNVTLKPVRMSAAYLMQIEDLARTSMIENRLRADLSMVMSDKMDEAVINGDSQLVTTGGLIGGAGEDLTVANTSHLTGTAQFTNNRKTFIDLLDGQYAATHADLRIGVSAYYYNHLCNTLTSDETMDVAQSLHEKGIRWKASKHVGDNSTPSNGDSLGLVHLKRGGTNAAIAAIWPTISLIRDIYTQAAKGQVRLTANMLWNFAMIRDSNFKNIKVSGL